MAINLAWDGQEAEAGLNKTAHLLKSTGIAALDAANNFSKLMQDKVKSLGLSDSEIRSLSRLSELDKERAIAKYEEEANYRKMSKNAQLLYEQMTRQAEEQAKAEEEAERVRAAAAAAEMARERAIVAEAENAWQARQRMMEGLNALEKEQLLAKEKERHMLLSMSAEQIRNYESMKRFASEQAENEKRLRSEYEARQKQLAGLTVLEKDQLFAKEKERALLLTMTVDQIKKYEADKAAAAKAKADAEARQKQLAGLSALEKQRLFEQEARRQKILGMTARQQLAFEAQEKAAEKARAKAEAWADMTWIEKIKKSLKGAQDIKATIELVRGLFRLVTSGPLAAGGGIASGATRAIGLGAELETMQIQMGTLVKSFDKGAQSLEVLRQITRDMGVPLKDLVGAFSQLVGAGVGAGDAEKLLRTFSAISPLLGQGGISQLAGSIASMAKSGIAEQSGLQQLQQSGLPVYEALAEKLTRITGVFHDMRSAQEAVERGAVLASTAIGAMQDAARSPQALEAARRISNSVEGQLSRLKEGFTELLRDIGTGLIKGLDIPAFLASLRGVFEALQIITQQIVQSFLSLAGPGEQGGNLEKSFKRMRDLAFDISEKLANVFNDARVIFEKIIRQLESFMYKAGEIAKGGVTGFASGKSTKGFYYEDQLVKEDIKQIEEAGKKRAEALKGFFGNARTAAIWQDMQRAADMVPGAQQGGAQINLAQRSAAINDPFQALRDMQMQMRQGGLLAGSKVAETFGAFIKNGQADPNAWMAGKIEAGSAAAADAIMQHQYGQDAKSLQQQIADGIKATEELNKRQVENEQEMIKILKTLRLPTARV